MSAYVELHCHSNFSLLDGASHPEELAARAAELQMPALALTDHNAVYGAVRFIQAAKVHGIQPILGAELTLCDGDASDDTHHLTLLVENQAGWHNLCYLISRAQHNAPKGQAVLPFAELTGCTDGLIALSGCRQGKVARSLVEQASPKTAVLATHQFLELFGRHNFFIELQNHLLPEDELRNGRLTALADYLNLACVVTNNVHYHVPDRHRLQDVLVCINHLITLDESAHLRRMNAEYFLKSAEQMAALFPGQPEALTNTLRIAERCRFELSYGLQDLPFFPHGKGDEQQRLSQPTVP